ncbi:uncharacterized protein LOC127129632 [Lathyrus oleraceus]|uniref:uncharacterized protein LOC127129632 n=1 Tax=Pisum sativum TaxID=3888 RepID=UPI0021D1B50E|nr:uncharacterized protein LOC127129632 [Pisum sativum]
MRSQIRQLMETIQAVARGQEVMAKMQEEMNQRASTTNPPTPLVVETPTLVPQVDPPININASGDVPNDNPRPHVFETDDQHDAFFSPRDASQDDAFGSTTNEVERKVKAIEEKLKAIWSTDVLGFDVAEMCLDSLSGESLDWYMQLEGNHIHTSREMAEAFLKHYQYNTDMAPNCTQLQNLTQRPEESFKEYAQRWRELVARVQPLFLERELVYMFMGNLQGPYLDRMVGSTSSSFSDLVLASERIENMIKMGKIQNSASTSSASKKPFVPYGKKREGETSAFSIIRTRNPTYPQVASIAPVQPSQQQPFAIPVQTQQQQQQYQQQPQRQQPQYQQQQQRMRRPERRFDTVPMPYSHILPNLLRGSLVQLRELGPPATVLPPGYDANARCEFNSGAPGHSIENCKALKYKVQELIDSKAITFSPKRPNVNNNLMPPHNNASVNMMEADNGRRLMSCVDELKTPLIEIKNALMKDNAFPICSNDCEHYMINPQQCRMLKSVIQQLMDQGILVVDCPSIKEDVFTLEIPYDEVPHLQIPYDFSQLTLSTNPVTPIIITVHTPFPYVDTKAVPWMYDTLVYIHGQKIQEESLKSSDPMINITGTSGITRSGRIFAPTPTPIGTINPSNSDKGKQIDGAQQRQDLAPSNEVDEFLRIIKKSGYRVVDQLNQTPSKISMLSLLMCSEAHRDALVKFLRTSHVPQAISVCQFEGVVNNIATSLSLVLSRVLIDIGSSLNVMPKSSFAKLTVEGLVMKPSEIIVRAFDGTRRTVIDEVNFPMKIGPHTFLITFFVMDIYPAYICLLGRPWIRSAGAVTSMFHQKLKFLVDDKLVVVEGEEDIVVSHLASFRYVGGEGEMREIPFQSFEVINVEMVCPTRDESKDAESPMASLKDALTIIKDGHPQGWGRLLELHANKDRAEEEEEDDDGLIFTKTDGNCATKCTEIEIPKVTLIEISSSTTTNDNSATVSYDFDNPINQADEECEEEAELPEELARILKQEEKFIQPHEESVEVINLGTYEEAKEV